MSISFALCLPEQIFRPVSSAPKDGSIIFLRDVFGHVDLASWQDGEWMVKFGVCDEYTHFAHVSIFDYED